jgi:DNA replication and repair protein RecF
VAVNQLPIRKLGDLFGNLLTVSFSPEDLKLVKSGPRERRRFVDIELCQLSGLYYQELQRYYHVLKQRNNLLRAIKNKSEGYDTLFAWDRHLVDHGFRICIQRGKFVKLLNETASEIHAGITQGKEKLRIEYAPNTQPGDLEEFIIKNRQRDIYRGATSVGIHRDDLRFFLNDADCKTFGSQGQQRTAALSSKLAVLRLIKRLKGFDPVLLLDDVLSELDKGRQQFLMAGTENIQVILTCTEMDGIKNIVPADSRIMTVTAGHVG